MKKVFFFLVVSMLVASCNPTASETCPAPCATDSCVVAIDSVQVDTAKVDSL